MLTTFLTLMATVYVAVCMSRLCVQLLDSGARAARCLDFAGSMGSLGVALMLVAGALRALPQLFAMATGPAYWSMGLIMLIVVAAVKLCLYLLLDNHYRLLRAALGNEAHYCYNYRRGTRHAACRA